MASISRLFRYVLCYHLQASPISLATTFGISVDVFSSSYWDVSVHPVRLAWLCIHHAIPFGGFPHSEISGSKLICQLPEAYRRLSRPSSPIIAKASTMCSYSLDPITLMFLSKQPVIFKEYLSGLSPDALCRNVNYSSILLSRIIRHYWISNVKFDIRFDAIKYVASGTVCTKPLRMCSFR